MRVSRERSLLVFYTICVSVLSPQEMTIRWLTWWTYLVRVSSERSLLVFCNICVSFLSRQEMTTKMVDMVDVSCESVQREIIACIPEVVSDEEHNAVAVKLQ